MEQTIFLHISMGLNLGIHHFYCVWRWRLRLITYDFWGVNTWIFLHDLRNMEQDFMVEDLKIWPANPATNLVDPFLLYGQQGKYIMFDQLVRRPFDCFGHRSSIVVSAILFTTKYTHRILASLINLLVLLTFNRIKWSQ